MDEALDADRIVVMDKGKVVIDGLPGQVFSDIEAIGRYGLKVPQISELVHSLNANSLDIPSDIIYPEQLYACLTEMKYGRIHEKRNGMFAEEVSPQNGPYADSSYVTGENTGSKGVGEPAGLK